MEVFGYAWRSLSVHRGRWHAHGGLWVCTEVLRVYMWVAGTRMDVTLACTWVLLAVHECCSGMSMELSGVCIWRFPVCAWALLACAWRPLACAC
eukprot:364435-Chlamydomonas_euryale.AAC.3